MPQHVYDALASFSFNGNRRGPPVDAGLVYQTPAMAAGVRPAHPLGFGVNGEINKGWKTAARVSVSTASGFNEKDVVFTGRAYCGCALAAS